MGLSMDSASQLLDSAKNQMKEIKTLMVEKKEYDEKKVSLLTKTLNTLDEFLRTSNHSKEGILEMKSEVEAMQNTCALLNEKIASFKNPDRPMVSVPTDKMDTVIGELAGVIKGAWTNYRATHSNLPVDFDTYFSGLNGTEKKDLIKDVYVSVIRGNISVNALDKEFKDILQRQQQEQEQKAA